MFQVGTRQIITMYMCKLYFLHLWITLILWIYAHVS